MHSTCCIGILTLSQWSGIKPVIYLHSMPVTGCYLCQVRSLSSPVCVAFRTMGTLRFDLHSTTTQ